MGVDAIDQTICPEVLGMTKCSIAWVYSDMLVFDCYFDIDYAGILSRSNERKSGQKTNPEHI